MDTEQLPKWTYTQDRPSARTEEDREAHYRDWLTRFGQRYTDATIASGGTPWHTSDDERRELFMRRYTQPRPPADMPSLTPAQIRGQD